MWSRSRAMLPLLLFAAFAWTGCKTTQQAGEEVATTAEGVADEAEDIFDDEITVELVPSDGSTVAGDADLRPSGASTRIEIELTGLTAGSTYTPMIHHGTCVAVGDMVTQLEPFTAAGTEGGSTATIDPTLLTGMDHVVVVHDETGAIVTCGEIREQTM